MAKPSDSIRRWAKRIAPAPSGARAAEVNALVSTPLRLEVSGPAIRTQIRADAPFLREGAETSTASTPSGVETYRQGRKNDQVLVHGSTAARRPGTASGVALSKCVQPDQATAGPRLRTSVLLHGGENLGTASRCRHWWGAFAAPEGLLPPGCEVSYLSRVVPARGANRSSSRTRAQPRYGGRIAVTEYRCSDRSHCNAIDHGGRAAPPDVPT